MVRKIIIKGFIKCVFNLKWHFSRLCLGSGKGMVEIRKGKVDRVFHSKVIFSSIIDKRWKRTVMILNMANKHPCTMCVKSFSFASELARHKPTHSGVKMHKCGQCNTSFSQAAHLKTHLLTHSGEKPHKCNQCNHATTTAKALKSHIMTHTGEKPYKCSQCGFSSITSGHMKIHKRTSCNKTIWLKHTWLNNHLCSTKNCFDNLTK